MKTIPLLAPVLSLFLLVVTSGCDRALVVKTRLEPNEKISRGDTILVDGVAAGCVKALSVESGNRVAILELTNNVIAQERLKSGIVRVAEEGRIHLRSDLVRPDSSALQAGAFIPLQSKSEFVVNKYATKQTLVFVGIVLVALLVLSLVLKKAFNFGLVILCLALAGLTGWILHPYLIPHIEKSYAAPAIHSNADVNEKVPASENEDSPPIKEWETKFVRALEQRPDPRVAAFAAILVLSFIPYAILLGSAMRSLRREA